MTDHTEPSAHVPPLYQPLRHIAGTYITRRDGGRHYSYACWWHMSEQGLDWGALVKDSAGDIAGTPAGTLQNWQGAPPDAQVIAQLQVHIEDQVGVT